MAAGLTKTQLIRQLAEKTELPNKTAAAFLEHLAQSADRRTHPDQGQDRREVPRRQSREGRDRSQEVTTILFRLEGRPASRPLVFARCRDSRPPQFLSETRLRA